MIVMVTGGRDYAWNDATDGKILKNLLAFFKARELWHGGAIGVDTRASNLAKSWGLSTRVFLAEPCLFDTEIARALCDRNTTMIAELQSKILHENERGCVIAFPGGNGTHDAVTKALHRRLHVIDLRAADLGHTSTHG